MNDPWYKEWFNSPFYHKLYLTRDEKEASAFIDILFGHLHPPPGSRMLDTGCGRGRHALYMAGKGFFVTGIDLAEENIRYARRFEDERLEFFQHDMRLPFRTNYYDYAFNFFTSFGYFKTRREHEDILRTIAGALKPGGILVIDYLNVHYTEDHLVPSEEKQIDGTKYSIRRWQDDNHFYKRISIQDPSLPSPLEYTERVLKFSFGDFTEMLAFEKIQVTNAYGDYRLNHYDNRKSPRLIITAQKTGRD